MKPRPLPGTEVFPPEPGMAKPGDIVTPPWEEKDPRKVFIKAFVRWTLPAVREELKRLRIIKPIEQK